jgi:NADH-quinone oxidoreductase subunit N
MIQDQLIYMAPELTLLIFALAVIILDLFVKQKKALAAVSIAGVLCSAVFAAILWGKAPVDYFYTMLASDNFAILFKFLLLASLGLVILASQDYVSKFPRFQGEYYALLMISATALMWLSAAIDLISIFVALELSGIALYVLVSFMKDQKSSEAGLKYLLLGAVASAILLYGMTFIFGTTGQTCLLCAGKTIAALPGKTLVENPGLMIGLVLLIGGFGFKIASFPFQMWVPDVYEGAPTPITAYLSVASKAAGFAVLTRILLGLFGSPAWLSGDWALIIAILAAITMTVGNVAALMQTNIKRLFGYSSIAQAGYLMVGLAAIGSAAGTPEIRSGLLFFFMSYIATNLGAFIAIIAITNKIGSDNIEDFTGMIKRAPVLAVALSLCLISLIGLPPTGGMIAKIYIFSGAVQQGFLWLVIVAVINSAISAFYYLKVVKYMWTGAPASEEKVPSTLALRVALALCCLLVLILGVVPGAFFQIAQSAVKLFSF